MEVELDLCVSTKALFGCQMANWQVNTFNLKYILYLVTHGLIISLVWLTIWEKAKKQGGRRDSSGG